MSYSDNTFSFLGDTEAQIAFMKSSIDSCNKVIEHYDFVINDISSQISNPVLQATKEKPLSFLKDMRKEWLQFRNDLQQTLERVTAGEK